MGLGCRPSPTVCRTAGCSEFQPYKCHPLEGTSPGDHRHAFNLRQDGMTGSMGGQQRWKYRSSTDKKYVHLDKYKQDFSVTMYGEVSLDKWEEYNRFFLINTFHNPLRIPSQPLSTIGHVYTSYIYLTQIIQIYVPCTYLINVNPSFLKASCYSAGFKFVFKIYYVGDPSATLWSAFPIKSEERSGVLRREIMIAYGYDLTSSWLWNNCLCLKKIEHICPSKEKKKQKQNLGGKRDHIKSCQRFMLYIKLQLGLYKGNLCTFYFWFRGFTCSF